ncbi:MAG: peptidylprolyl isomerase [Coriobacteriales bacterium]|nr:peptidylprolyl isomerase [Coriobacteriales bacterium]MBQ6585666.1 peptidylprolyl isomerase [Coriobacteriales bacterium]
MSNDGKQVAVHYEGTFDDGTVFDSSYMRGEPLRFTCMAGQMIKGFDLAVKDMEVGQVVNIHLAPADAYGERDPQAVQTVPLSALGGPEAVRGLRVGARVQLQGPYGPMPATITSITHRDITFDFNHEMAGKALNFKIELLSVD